MKAIDLFAGAGGFSTAASISIADTQPAAGADVLDAKRWQLRCETLRALFPSAPSDYELDTAIGAAIAALATQPALAAQGEPLPEHADHDTQPAAGADVPPAQPAPVVPDVQREIADALALFPVDLESKTFRVNVYNQSQVIEADGDTQFFSKKKVMALLEKLHGHLTAAATPTPPAQAAADARDAGRYRMVRRGQHWSVINGIGDTLRGDDLDAAIDAQM